MTSSVSSVAIERRTYRPDQTNLLVGRTVDRAASGSREWLPQRSREASLRVATRRNPRSRRDSAGTPGGTRIPNLLIRRSPSRVHSRPQPSTQPGTEGLQVHSRPYPSTGVQSYWLPDWLPTRVLTSVVPQKQASATAHAWRGPPGCGAGYPFSLTRMELEGLEFRSDLCGSCRPLGKVRRCDCVGVVEGDTSDAAFHSLAYAWS